MKKVLILGNSRRQAELAKLLGKSVSVMHFGKSAPREALELCDCVVLPLPAVTEGCVTGTEVKLSEIFGFGKKLYIGGRISDDFLPFSGEYDIIDYTLREEFARKNAFPTAEAAIMIAMGENDFTLHGSSCLVGGMGRIGKALIPPLVSFGAQVISAARNEEARRVAENLGAQAYAFGELFGIGSVDVIFNTVPEVVFGERELKALCPKLIIDLASSPGGCDFDAAEKLGIKAVHALALPGKHFPKTAAVITAETILSILN